MDRATYCKISQAYNITGQHTVMHNGFEWYPKALEVTWDKNGNPDYSAKLIAKTARHSVCYAKLESVSAVKYGNSVEPLKIEPLRSKNILRGKHYENKNY